MNIQQATRSYETWLAERIVLIPADLRLKHERMRQSLFAFLRATFYRWAQVWPNVCAELADAPAVLAIGDLHVENFGTWRDAEGRLVWGVNDFDETCWLPYVNDLVRLAVSAVLAASENHLSCGLEEVCDAIIDGYESGIRRGGRLFVLAEHHGWLRKLAISDLRDPIRFWQKLEALPSIKTGVPKEVRARLQEALPSRDLPFRIVHRQAGLGSLGRRRYTALAQCHGGMIAREVKELRVSARLWAGNGGSKGRILYRQVLQQAVRVADPFLSVSEPWLVRRLAPDCSRIELETLPKQRDELNLVRVMGSETANIHLGTKAAQKQILRDLRKRSAQWLQRATAKMVAAVRTDWESWAGQ